MLPWSVLDPHVTGTVPARAQSLVVWSSAPAHPSSSHLPEAAALPPGHPALALPPDHSRAGPTSLLVLAGRPSWLFSHSAKQLLAVAVCSFWLEECKCHGADESWADSAVAGNEELC